MSLGGDTPLPAGAGTGIGRRRLFGIQVKLFAAFAAVAAMAVGSGVVAWISFTDTRDQLERLAQNILPTMTVAQNVAMEATTLAAATSALAEASSDPERRSLAVALETRASRLNGLLDSLGQLGFDQDGIAALRQAVWTLTENLSRQNLLVAVHIDRTARIRTRIATLGVAHRVYADTVASRIERSYRALSRQDTTSATDPALDEVRAMLELAAAVNRAVGLVNEALTLTDPARVRDLHHNFHNLSTGIETLAGRLRTSAQGRDLVDLAAPLMRFGLDSDNLFMLRAADLEAAAETAALLEESRHFAERLRAGADTLVMLARADADRGTRDTLEQLTDARRIQTAAAVVAVVAALLVAWLYVGRNIVARILALRYAMEFQAQGHDVTIPTGGDDEIGDMARALRVFVAERRRAWAAVEKQKKYFQTLIEQSTDGISILGADGEILYESPCNERILGYTPGDMVGRNVFDFMHPEDRSFAAERLRWLAASPGAMEANEFRLRHADGSWRVIQATVRNALEDPAIRGLLNNFRDVTERKQAERELEASKRELEQLNRQKDKLFSIIAHDLKGPFNTLLGFSDLVATSAGDLPPEAIAEYGGLIHESAAQIYRLLENLLDWARLQMDHVAFTPVPCDLNDLVQRSVGLLTPGAFAKKIRLINNVPRVRVVVDTDMIDTVVRNLIGNAVKFTHEGGTVTICARPLLDEDDSEIEVAVIDTGIGMPADKVETLFRLDAKTSTSGTRGEPGTGLGLLLCKDLVAKHGGTIAVDSTVGAGTTFRFTLPYDSSKV